MKSITNILIFLLFFLTASAQKKTNIISFGIDYRDYPIDIENVPRGGSSTSNGLPFDDSKFWKVVSLHGNFGIISKTNWLFSTSLYGRYNYLHRTEGIDISSTPYIGKSKSKKNFKFDFFVNIEKKFKIQKDKERYFFTALGIGFTNINSRFDVTLTDTADSRPFPSHHYAGTLLHFGTRISLGYQYEKIKFSLNTYLIEGPDLTNLSSLWVGATISYEIKLKR